MGTGPQTRVFVVLVLKEGRYCCPTTNRRRGRFGGGEEIQGTAATGKHLSTKQNEKDVGGNPALTNLNFQKKIGNVRVKRYGEWAAEHGSVTRNSRVLEKQRREKEYAYPACEWSSEPVLAQNPGNRKGLP